MTKVISTREISFRIENIIKKAEKEIILITPFLKIAPSLFEWLKIADEKGVEITLVYGKEKLLKKQESQLKTLNNCKILFSQNLHAKVYLNENDGIISSMNLYEFSEINNLEIGVHFSKIGYEDTTYQDTRNEISPIISSAVLQWDSSETRKEELEIASINALLESDSNDTTIPDFPIKGIHLDSSYGFATYNLNNLNIDLKKLSQRYLPTFEKELNGSYRVFWEFPHTRICLYDSKSKKFESDTHMTSYRIEGMKIVNQVIKQYFEK